MWPHHICKGSTNPLNEAGVATIPVVCAVLYFRVTLKSRHKSQTSNLFPLGDEAATSFLGCLKKAATSVLRQTLAVTLDAAASSIVGIAVEEVLGFGANI